jgi:ribosomal-protein-alanine N-acetyltransferase
MRGQIGDCWLRDWREEDAPALARYADNRQIWSNLRDAFPHPYRPEHAGEFIRRVSAASPRTVFAIATDSEAIGSIGLMPGQDVHRYTAELGYWLALPYWGRGIVTAAVRAMVEYGFRELGLHRVFAEPYAGNAASARVLEKAGFTLEGRLRASAFKDGKILDQLLYAIVGAGSSGSAAR